MLKFKHFGRSGSSDFPCEGFLGFETAWKTGPKKLTCDLEKLDLLAEIIGSKSRVNSCFG